MNIIFMGIQGSGKGTQAKLISEELKLCHISTGDLLRSTTGELKSELDKIINQGQLIPDNLMLKILKNRMIQDDCENGIILDGFPRNIEQAKLLEKEIKINKVIEIQISDEESRKRLLGRISCKKCGEGYNEYTEPKPKDKGICDKCGNILIKRDDDNLESINKRIDIYHKDTEPILDFYKNKTIKINGENPIEKISKEILEKIN